MNKRDEIHELELRVLSIKTQAREQSQKGLSLVWDKITQKEIDDHVRLAEIMMGEPQLQKRLQELRESSE